MSVLLRKKGEYLHLTGVGKLAVITLITSLASSIVDTIWSVYMNSFFNSIVLVGYFSAFLTLVSFISYFTIIPVIERISKSKIYAISLILFAISYVLFAINKNLYIFILLALITTILFTFRITSFGIIIRDKSNEKYLSRNEGLNYTFMNISWVVGPLIAGYISEEIGISSIFLIAAVFILCSLFLFKISNIKDINIKKKADENPIKNFIDFFRKKERVIAYIVGGGVSFWWTLIYLFMPLYIIKSGLHEKWIGFFLFAVSIPLILFTYSASKYTGKHGFKKVFKIGFLIPAVLSLACFFTNNIFFVMGLLVLASVGLSMIESTVEAYFFHIVKGKDEVRFYPPYNTAIETNHFTGRILSATLLIFLPFRYIFLIFAFFMFFFFLTSFKVKNIVEKRKNNK
ncbi:MAG: MFS transporter [Nanoarchaeota archaeon]